MLPLIYFFPAVLGKVTLAPGDGWTQILGIRVLIGQMIAQGDLPLWNPYIFAGMPLLASIQPGALYPTTWLFAVLSPQVAMNALVITTYHVALFGTYLFARRIGTTRVGALIAAMAFSFGGYMVAHLGHTNRIGAAAWLPWILLAIEQLRQRPCWRWVTLGALFIALQAFAGDPQMTLYTAMTAAAYGLFALFSRLQPQLRARFAMVLTAMVGCGGLLSMILLLPAREMQKLGDRAGIDYQYFAQFSFPPSQLFELFFPYFFGGATAAPYSVPYWGRWNLTETCGYVGMAAWLLAFAAVFAARYGTESGSDRVISQDYSPREPGRYRSPFPTDGVIRFWAILAVVALLLAFGSFLPFDINKLLHRVPVFNLFRASGRNLFEFDFALAMLAGLGATALAQLDRVSARRVLLKSSAVLATIVVAGAVVYCFFGKGLKTEVPIPAKAADWSNPEFYFPMVFLALSVAAIMLYARRWSALSGAALTVVLFLDLFSFGFFYEWRLIDNKHYNVTERLADPPSVKFIKQREADWNSFRVLSQSPTPYDGNSDLLNYPNFSVVRGLQMVNGYDPARLPQMSEVAGRLTLDGVMMEHSALSAQSQGFNLLNAKYLLNERATLSDQTITYDGVGFDARQMDLPLELRGQVRLDARATASELAIISSMENAGNVVNGSQVLNVRLRTTDGRMIEQELLAGRDTGHWKPDASAAIASRNKTGVLGKGFLARLKFDRAEIESVEFECLLNSGGLMVTRASLFDAATNSSLPLAAVNLPPERWRKLIEFGEVEVYENLKALPRAWFANKAIIAPSAEALRIVKTGRLADGQAVNFGETVLLESELFAKRQLKIPLANSSSAVANSIPNSNNDVKVTRYSPNRIELQANNSQPGFLVLSEIYFRGWEVWVDGKRSSVDRVNFTLRGVELSPGNHKVEFVFRAPSFRTGAVYSAIGLLLLGVGGIVSYRKRQ
ncbi:MAG: YfhO family protein [Blastocatellia bacterium]